MTNKYLPNEILEDFPHIFAESEMSPSQVIYKGAFSRNYTTQLNMNSAGVSFNVTTGNLVHFTSTNNKKQKNIETPHSMQFVPLLDGFNSVFVNSKMQLDAATILSAMRTFPGYNSKDEAQYMTVADKMAAKPESHHRWLYNMAVTGLQLRLIESSPDYDKKTASGTVVTERYIDSHYRATVNGKPVASEERISAYDCASVLTMRPCIADPCLASVMIPDMGSKYNAIAMLHTGERVGQDPFNFTYAMEAVADPIYCRMDGKKEPVAMSDFIEERDGNIYLKLSAITSSDVWVTIARIVDSLRLQAEWRQVLDILAYTTFMPTSDSIEGSMMRDCTWTPIMPLFFSARSMHLMAVTGVPVAVSTVGVKTSINTTVSAVEFIGQASYLRYVYELGVCDIFKMCQSSETASPFVTSGTVLTSPDTHIASVVSHVSSRQVNTSFCSGVGLVPNFRPFDVLLTEGKFVMLVQPMTAPAFRLHCNRAVVSYLHGGKDYEVTNVPYAASLTPLAGDNNVNLKGIKQFSSGQIESIKNRKDRDILTYDQAASVAQLYRIAGHDVQVKDVYTKQAVNVWAPSSGKCVRVESENAYDLGRYRVIRSFERRNAKLMPSPPLLLMYGAVYSYVSRFEGFTRYGTYEALSVLADLHAEPVPLDIKVGGLLRPVNFDAYTATMRVGSKLGFLKTDNTASAVDIVPLQATAIPPEAEPAAAASRVSRERQPRELRSIDNVGATALRSGRQEESPREEFEEEDYGTVPYSPASESRRDWPPSNTDPRSGQSHAPDADNE